MRAVYAAFLHEFRRIFTVRAAFSVLVVAAALYAAFYPQPYLNEALRRVPIAVVDNDDSTASRELARRIDATADVAVTLVFPDMAGAERAVFARDVYGILFIPKDFERSLLHGRGSPVALYADASYFLVYQRIALAVTAVARTMGAEIETARLIGAGIDPVAAAAASDPLPLTAVPLFNPQGGYATYLLPAAFVLIVQQTLLIGVGLLSTLPDRPAAAGAAATVIGKLLAYTALEALIIPAYLVILPALYGLPRLGSLMTILIMALPFVLAVGALGLLLAALFRNALTVQLAMAALGIPLFFLAGFSWPAEAMPHTVQMLSLLIPSTSAIDGLVRIAQMGASLSQVARPLLTLSGLAVLYAAAALAVESRRRGTRTGR